MDALRELNRGRSKLGFFWIGPKIFLVSIVLFAVIRTFLVEAFKIPSGSMETRCRWAISCWSTNSSTVPRSVTHKRLPRLREPQRGDVIVFEYPEDPPKTS